MAARLSVLRAGRTLPPGFFIFSKISDAIQQTKRISSRESKWCILLVICFHAFVSGWMLTIQPGEKCDIYPVRNVGIGIGPTIKLTKSTYEVPWQKSWKIRIANIITAKLAIGNYHDSIFIRLTSISLRSILTLFSHLFLRYSKNGCIELKLWPHCRT
jgi:hypothetical protein